MIFIELDDNLTKSERQRIKEILVLYGLIENDNCWMIDDQQYKLAINQILKEFVDIDVSKRSKRDIRLIGMKNINDPYVKRTELYQALEMFGEKINKSMEERMIKVINAIVPNMISEALKPIMGRLDGIDSRLTNLEFSVQSINARIDNLVSKNNLIE